MKTLVTGGTGFLGRRVVAELLRRGHDVRCLARSGPAAARLRAELPAESLTSLELVSGSLQDVRSCRGLIDGCDRIVHVAAAKTGAPALLFLNTVTTTRALVEAARNTHVERFVLVSSLGVYGTNELKRGEELTEECPVDPTPERRDPYTFAKVAQEQVCWDAYREYKLPLVIIRPGVIYGPGGDCLSARVGLRFGNTMLRIGGGHRLPYIYVDNCAQAIALAATAAGVEGHAYNVIDDELPTGREVLRTYRKRVEHLHVIPLPLTMLPLAARLYEGYRIWSNGLIPPVLTRYRTQAQWKPLRYPNQRAKTALAWSPIVGMEEGLRRTTAYLRARAN
jgi:nucleoside-diphosphate-sugar epimerase